MSVAVTPYARATLGDIKFRFLNRWSQVRILPGVLKKPYAIKVYGVLF